MVGTRLSVSFAAALLTPTLFGAEVNRSWETLVSTLKPGRRVVVVQQNRRQVEGKVLSLNGESVTVQAVDQPLTIKRDEVFKVRVAGTRSKRSLIGLAAGIAAGVAFGVNLGSRRHATSALAFGGIFGAIGAAAGAAIPVGAPLYEAPGGLKTGGGPYRPAKPEFRVPDATASHAPELPRAHPGVKLNQISTSEKERSLDRPAAASLRDYREAR